VDTDRPAGESAFAAATCAVRLTREDSIVREIEDAIARSSFVPGKTEFEPGAILFTSGSTGEPKGVLKSESALWWNVVESTIWGARTTSITEIFAIPLGHLNFWDIAMPAYWSGGGVYLMDGFSADGFIDTAGRFDAVSTCITPGMMARILDAGSDRITLPSLASVVLWSDLADDLRLELVDAHGEIFRFCYGITEGSSFAATTREFVTHPGACGRPVAFCSLEIRDEEGSLLPVGESGQVWQRTPTAYTRYVGAADPAKARRDGVDCFYTGDLGRVDADGRLYLEGRDGLSIKTGGLNVRPAEVEAVLMLHPGVRSCIVVGAPDREWGEAVVAVVEPKRGATLDGHDLLAFARHHLAGYQCPKQVLVVDTLPIMPNGKFDRRGIKAAVAAGTLTGVEA
jgi:acyl-CoA synthetase (AMP-forming)/AMP-acid ligase II